MITMPQRHREPLFQISNSQTRRNFRSSQRLGKARRFWFSGIRAELNNYLKNQAIWKPMFPQCEENNVNGRQTIGGMKGRQELLVLEG